MNDKSTLRRLIGRLVSSLTFVLGITAVLVLGAVLAQSVRNANIAATGNPTPLEVSNTTPPNGYPAPVATNIYPTDYPPVKLTLEHQIEQTRNAALTGTLPPTNAKGAPPTPVGTEVPWPTGIVEDGESPFATSFVFKNRWQEVVDGQRIIVYAGSTKSDASQGIVLVWEVSRDFNQVYPSSVREGALRVLAANDLRLTLTTESGTSLYFDVPSRQFVDSLTATPPPTVTGVPSPIPSSIPTAYPGAIPSPVSTSPTSP